MTISTIYFPRFNEDISTELRTLFHMPLGGRVWKMGDMVRLTPTAVSLQDRGVYLEDKVAVVTDVRLVRLLAELDVDLGKLAALDRAEYLSRWDTLHPEWPSSGDPRAWRIEIRYTPEQSNLLDPPAWSLAS